MCQATRRDCRTKKVPNALPGTPAAAPGDLFAFRLACSTTRITPQRTSPLKPSAHSNVPAQAVPKNNAARFGTVRLLPALPRLCLAQPLDGQHRLHNLPKRQRPYYIINCEKVQQIAPPPRNPEIPGESGQKRPSGDGHPAIFEPGRVPRFVKQPPQMRIRRAAKKA